jgi:hypothetical protein
MRTLGNGLQSKPRQTLSLLRIFSVMLLCLLAGKASVSAQQVFLDNLDSYFFGSGSTNATSYGLVWTNNPIGLLQEDVNVTLLGGSSTNNLTNIVTLTLADGSAFGDVIEDGVFLDSSSYVIPGVADNGYAVLEVQLWLGNATNYAAAVLEGAPVADSGPFSNPTGGSGTPPSIPPGLEGMPAMILQPASGGTEMAGGSSGGTTSGSGTSGGTDGGTSSGDGAGGMLSGTQGGFVSGLSSPDPGPPALTSATSTPRFTPDGYFAISGAGNLQWLSAVSGVTNSTEVWLTNSTARASATNTTTVTFTIAGGQDGNFYDVFGTSSIVSPLTNSVWAWLGQGQHGNTYSVVVPSKTAFLLLGKPQDTNGDGLTDAYDRLVTHTNQVSGASGVPYAWYLQNGLDPNSGTQDPDFDGLMNFQEYLFGTKPNVSEGTSIWAAGGSVSIP